MVQNFHFTDGYCFEDGTNRKKARNARFRYACCYFVNSSMYNKIRNEHSVFDTDNYRDGLSLCQLILKSLNLSLFHASGYIHLSILLKLRASPKVFLNKIILFI